MSYDDERPMVGSSYRPKSRRCCIVSVLSVSLALLLILAIAIPVGINKSQKDDLKGEQGVGPACDATSYPAECRNSLQGSDGTPQGMSKVVLQQSDAGLQNVQNATQNPECQELFTAARNSVLAVFLATQNGTDAQRKAACQDSQTQLSAAIEQVDTCGTILQELQSPDLAVFSALSPNATVSLSIALSFTNCFCTYGNNLKNWKQFVPDGFQDIVDSITGPNRRRLLDAEDLEDESRDGSYLSDEVPLPGWMDSASARHLLSQPRSYNVIVAKDRSGRYSTVQQAIDNAPKNDNLRGPRYTIYVKKGIYNEQIIIPSNKVNLVIIGDGIDQTIFTGARNVMLMRGMTTFLSATLIVKGSGFIGKYFTVRNTSPSAGHQAVACRVSADFTAFYQVKFDSLQDTLYAHTFRQFYSNCIVSGTVDFIFGNGNAVFQGCTILAKKSQLLGQQNTCTAQGKFDKNQNTGLAFQDCNFDGTAELKQNVQLYPTFLGRPWKMYSTCVLLRPTLQAHIDPKGWLYWNFTDFGLKTSFFAEYQGRGPGSNRRNRVYWSHEIKDSITANKYQARSFISGQSWLPSLGIAYSLASV